MMIFLISFGLAFLIILLVAWRGVDLDFSAALTTAVVCTGILAGITYAVANFSRLM
jgi:hypothetical protein